MSPVPQHRSRTQASGWVRSEEHTSELQSHHDLVCRLLLEKKKTKQRDDAERSTREPTQQDCTSITTSSSSIPSTSTAVGRILSTTYMSSSTIYRKNAIFTY